MFKINTVNKVKVNYSLRLIVPICLYGNFHSQQWELSNSIHS